MTIPEMYKERAGRELGPNNEIIGKIVNSVKSIIV